MVKMPMQKYSFKSEKDTGKTERKFLIAVENGEMNIPRRAAKEAEIRAGRVVSIMPTHKCMSPQASERNAVESEGAMPASGDSSRT